MTTISPEIYPPTRFEAWLERRNISWLIVILLLSGIIFFFELPFSLKPGTGGIYRTSVYAATIIGYALACIAIVRRFLKRVIRSLQPLMDDAKTDEGKSLRFEWQSALIVGLVMVTIFVTTAPQFVNSQGEIEVWLLVGGVFIANAVFGWVIFALFAGANQVTNVVSKIIVRDIFDTAPFRPVAHWCLAIAVSIMGAVTIATLFLREEMFTEFNMVTYAFALIVGVFVFFAGMWSTHQLMLKNKQREIKKLDLQLSRLHEEILNMVEMNELEGAKPILETSAKLSAHRELVEDIPVWPYTLGNLGSLFTSIAIPVMINIVLRIFR